MHYFCSLNSTYWLFFIIKITMTQLISMQKLCNFIWVGLPIKYLYKGKLVDHMVN